MNYEPDNNDFLGLTAAEGTKARAAINQGDFDTAWSCYQKMSELYLKHAIKYDFTKQQTLDLVGRTHVAMAKMLKQEGKHTNALIHILYSSACSSCDPSKDLKLYRPYVNRCKFESISLEFVQAKLQTWKEAPDLVEIRDTINQWA